MDSFSDRRLLRGLSKTSENIQLVNKARDAVLGDIVEDKVTEKQVSSALHFVDTPEYTFILPDLTKFPADFRAFLHKDLIETSTLVSLEQAGQYLSF
jgi:OTU domain-containing protein 7